VRQSELEREEAVEAQLRELLVDIGRRLDRIESKLGEQP